MKGRDLTSLNQFSKDLFGDLLLDDTVTEIAINNYKGIWIEDDKGWDYGENQLDPILIENFCVALASFNDDEISYKKPILSASLPDRSRVQIVVKNATDNISITIRKPSSKHISFDDYINSGFFQKIEKEKPKLSNDDIKLCEFFDKNNYIDFIKSSVELHKNIVVCGGTGSGKTTFMKSLLDLMDEKERIITIEDVPEIFFQKHKNFVKLYYPSEVKPNDIVSSSTLLKSCLRMKPDRILLAELRGGETFDYLNVIMSGHDGGITSCHASSVEDTFKRLLSMASQHESSKTLGIEFLKTLLDSVHVIINIDKDFEYNRRINEIYFDKYNLFKNGEY